MKTNLFHSVATAEFSRFAGILNAALSQHHLLGFEIAQLKFEIAGQRLTDFFAKRMHWSQQTPSSKNTREDSTHVHHKMINTKIRFIIFFSSKDGEALYSQQKQDQELTVAQIINSLLPNSDLH